jgi:hypothetical protein
MKRWFYFEIRPEKRLWKVSGFKLKRATGKLKLLVHHHFHRVNARSAPRRIKRADETAGNRD